MNTDVIIVGLGLLIAALITALTVIVRRIPDYIDKAIDIRNQSEAVKQTAALDESKGRAESAHADAQLTLAASKMLEIQGQALISLLNEQTHFRDTIGQATTAIKGNGDQIVGMTEAVWKLQETQATIDGRIVEALQKLEQIRLSPALQTAKTEALEAGIKQLTDLANNLAHTQTEISILAGAIRDAQTLLMQRKTDSQPIKQIVLDDKPEGK